MIEATEADREIARDIEDRCVNRHNIVAGDLPSAIALALATAREEGRKAPKGCVVDDEGRVLKVDGELPVNLDGHVVGNNAYQWLIMTKADLSTVPMRICYRIAPIQDPDAYTPGPMQTHSTREAAQAAKEAGK